MAQALCRLNVGAFSRRCSTNGTIADEERIELIEGLLVSKRGGVERRSSGTRGCGILWRMIPPGWHVAKGVPIVLSDWSRPDPTWR